MNYSVDVLVRCKHDGTAEATAPAITRPVQRPPIDLITDRV